MSRCERRLHRIRCCTRCSAVRETFGKVERSPWSGDAWFLFVSGPVGSSGKCRLDILNTVEQGNDCNASTTMSAASPSSCKESVRFIFPISRGIPFKFDLHVSCRKQASVINDGARLLSATAGTKSRDCRYRELNLRLNCFFRPSAARA